MKIISCFILLSLGISLNGQGITNTLGGDTADDKFIVENSDANPGLVVTGEGTVGIGTINPHLKLHVVGNSGEGMPSFTAGTLLALQQNDYGNWTHLAIIAGTAGQAGLSFGNVNDDDIGALRYNNADNSMHFLTNATDQMVITENGDVGIGTNDPKQKLHVYGKLLVQDGHAGLEVIPEGDRVNLLYDHQQGERYNIIRLTWGRIYLDANVGILNYNPIHLLDVGNSGAYCDGGAWVDGSSRKYKENISPLTVQEAMKTFTQLEPIKFNYKTDSEEKYIGFIAEDVPELVATKDRNGLSPMDIVAVLTKVTQEQQKVINNLTKRVEELEND